MKVNYCCNRLYDIGFGADVAKLEGAVIYCCSIIIILVISFKYTK
jgi:hypothetical protein